MAEDCRRGTLGRPDGPCHTVAEPPHPPAGATTLIVSLGLLKSVPELLSIVVAVLLVTAVSVALNHAFGRPQPWWV